MVMRYWASRSSHNALLTSVSFKWFRSSNLSIMLSISYSFFFPISCFLTVLSAVVYFLLAHLESFLLLVLSSIIFYLPLFSLEFLLLVSQILKFLLTDLPVSELNYCWFLTYTSCLYVCFTMLVLLAFWYFWVFLSEVSVSSDCCDLEHMSCMILQVFPI